MNIIIFGAGASGHSCRYRSQVLFCEFGFGFILTYLSRPAFFKKRMTSQGVILVHDYFASGYKGSRAAVDQFVDEYSGIIRKSPIGDDASILLCGE